MQFSRPVTQSKHRRRRPRTVTQTGLVTGSTGTARRDRPGPVIWREWAKGPRGQSGPPVGILEACRQDQVTGHCRTTRICVVLVLYGCSGYAKYSGLGCRLDQICHTANSMSVAGWTLLITSHARKRRFARPIRTSSVSVPFTPLVACNMLLTAPCLNAPRRVPLAKHAAEYTPMGDTRAVRHRRYVARFLAG